MASKLIGGHGLVTARDSRNDIARVDMPRKGVSLPVLNSAVTVTASDTTGLAISNDGLFGMVGSSATPFIRVLDIANDQWISPLSANPATRVDDIVFNDAGTEFFCSVNGTPFHARYSWPAGVLQTALATTPAAASPACCYGGGGSIIAMAVAASPYIQAWNIPAGTAISFTPASGAPTGQLTDIAMNAAGTMLATAGTGTTGRGYRVWAFPAGTTLLNLDTSVAAGGAVCCEFSPDGTQLAYLNTTSARHVRIFNTTTWAFFDITATQPFSIVNPRVLKWLGNTHVWVANETSACIFNVVTGAVVHYIEYPSVTNNGSCYPSPLTLMRKLDGNVKNAALANVARTVRAYHAATGLFVGEGVSNAGTGNFSIIVCTAEPCTVVVEPGAGENARSFSPITPVAL